MARKRERREAKNKTVLSIMDEALFSKDEIDAFVVANVAVARGQVERPPPFTNWGQWCRERLSPELWEATCREVWEDMTPEQRGAFFTINHPDDDEDGEDEDC